MADRVVLYANEQTGHADGYCALVETWGSDERIVESARMSTDGAFRGWGPYCAECNYPGEHHQFGCSRPGETKPGDEKLLRYLWTHGHHTPFEMAGAIVEMQVPIFVLRQVHRHRAASYNELSARYTEMPDAFWLPRPQDVRRQAGGNKQGSEADPAPEWQLAATDAMHVMAEAYERALDSYRTLLRLGVAREQARAVLPVAAYTRCRMQCNLRMMLHFLGLRLDAHAQVETRQLAEAIATLLRPRFPRTFALFDEGRRD